MYTISKVLVLLSVALSVTAIPHFARNSRDHNGIAARVAAPEPVAKPIEVLEMRQVVPERRLRKRSIGGRCIASSSSGSPPSSVLTKPSSIASSTSLYVPPHTSPANSYVPPPSSTYIPPPSSSYAAPPQSSVASGGSGVLGALGALLSQIFSGDGTFYAPGLGACGITNSASDMIAAVSWEFYDAFPGYVSGNPNTNPVCGRMISATYGGTTIQVQITDRCTGCAYGALDFAPAAFNQLANPSVGRIYGVTWKFD